VIETHPRIVPEGRQLTYRAWDVPELEHHEWQLSEYVNCVTLALVDYETGEAVIHSTFSVQSKGM